MALSFDWIRTRVARRILLLFVVGSALPVALMAVLSFVAVNRQIGDQAEERLEQLAKNAGQSVLQQLMLLEEDLRRTAQAVSRGQVELPSPHPSVVAMMTVGEGDPRLLTGNLFPLPPLGEDETSFLASGGTLLLAPEDGGVTLLVGRAVDGGGGDSTALWALVRGDSIWSAANTFTSLPSVADFCVLRRPESPLYCRSGSQRMAVSLSERRVLGSRGVVAVTVDGTDYLMGYWDLFLRPGFGAPTWTLVVAEGVDSVYAPLDAFSSSFLLVLAVALLLVLLLANVQVRRTMGPLSALGAGTQRIATGDFSARVPVSGDDEFGALADSFNTMAHELGVQFTQIEAAGAIDRAVLGAMDQDEVVGSVLDRFGVVVPCRSVAVLLAEPGSGRAASLKWRTGSQTLGGTALDLEPADREWLSSHRGSGVVEGKGGPSFIVRARVGMGPGPITVLPLMVQDQLRGALLFERATADRIESSDLERARRIADQATVALDEIRLIEELEETSWGTIRALARAIDAKSRWTSGHSERVTEMSLGLARVMGLDAEQMTTLHKGALLHDVGKIGVPATVLDRDGRLSEEEWNLIRQHPTIGGRILEPIRAFHPSLPIVLQHHERWDGQGYPAGLKGEEIHLLARILAVADAFDAITSPRPYHRAVVHAVGLHEIQSNAGIQFDPEPVAAFVTYMARRGVTPQAPTGDSHG